MLTKWNGLSRIDQRYSANRFDVGMWLGFRLARLSGMQRAMSSLATFNFNLNRKEMRRFRFVGDPSGYRWNVDLVKNEVYDGDRELNGFMSLEKTLKAVKDRCNDDSMLKDWQEVFDDPTKPLHKDTDLGYFAGLAMQAQFTQMDKYLEEYDHGWIDPFIRNSIILAKEIIKQLDKEVKGE